MDPSGQRDADQRHLPDVVQRFLLTFGHGAGPAWDALDHCFRVFRDLGWPDGSEPYSAAFLYAYVTHGPGDVGEKLRRILSAPEIGRLFQLSWSLEFREATDPAEVTYFTQRNYENLRKTIGEKVLIEQGALALPLLPFVDDHLHIDPASIIHVVHGDGRTAGSNLVSRIVADPAPLHTPGSYSLLISEDGDRRRVHLVQTSLCGGVVEALDDLEGVKACNSTVSLTWTKVVGSKVRALIEEFEWLVNEPKVKEADFQSFFEQNPEFLFLLGNYDDVRSQVTVRVESAISPLTGTSEFRPDFFLHDLSTGLWDALEIKKAHYQTRLLIGSGRNVHDTLAPSHVLNKALAQVAQYREVLGQATARDYLLREYGMRTARPRCVLLMGLEKNFPTSRSFTTQQLVREVGANSGVDLITFDRLLKLARHQKT